MKISFPDYFNGHKKFQSLYVNEDRFVDYTHKLDHIKHVQLNIERTFLVYVFSGQIELIGSDGVVKHVNQHEAALVPKGDYIMSEELSDDLGDFQALLFFLSEDLLYDFCKGINFSRDTKRQKLASTYVIKEHPLLKNYVESILLLRWNDQVQLDDNLIKMKAKELLFHLYSSNPTLLESILCQHVNSEKLEIKQVLEANFKHKLTMEKIAFLCGMSLSSFKRKFESLFDTTPGKWIREKRLETAQQLLLNKDLTISEIGYEVGFNSVSHFIQLFTDRYGKSPAKMRESLN